MVMGGDIQHYFLTVLTSYLDLLNNKLEIRVSFIYIYMKICFGLIFDSYKHHQYRCIFVLVFSQQGTPGGFPNLRY